MAPRTLQPRAAVGPCAALGRCLAGAACLRALRARAAPPPPPRRPAGLLSEGGPGRI